MKSKKDEKKLKVAVLGGSFDPPTIGHMQLASETLNLDSTIDEVWIIPCGARPDKKLSTTAEQRFYYQNQYFID